jgi:hypothetical protein
MVVKYPISLVPCGWLIPGRYELDEPGGVQQSEVRAHNCCSVSSHRSAGIHRMRFMRYGVLGATYNEILMSEREQPAQLSMFSVSGSSSETTISGISRVVFILCAPGHCRATDLYQNADSLSVCPRILYRQWHRHSLCLHNDFPSLSTLPVITSLRTMATRGNL